MRKIIFSVIIIMLLAVGSYKVSFALFSDQATSVNNTFSAAAEFPQSSEPYVDEVASVSGTFGHCCSDLSSDLLVAQALVIGAPDSPPDSDFIQISDNTVITLKFVNNKAIDGAGADIRIHIYDLLFPSTAKFEISNDGSTWVDMGNHLDTADVDLDINGTGLPFVKYVRITDLVEGGDPFPTLGFDLDAIEALNSVIDP